ncbi:MAG: cation transporting ATPase C-terminal domain-containing protein [Dehalococcoidia bacterium]|nr:cation transporting ATPase C-terminal domain-containing protein [Dehalococcoidia bacterium]MCA9855159.1 cation transporting ATPase C-terminal domain-containing protein [Dehalococcoidia bacterium]
MRGSFGQHPQPNSCHPPACRVPGRKRHLSRGSTDRLRFIAAAGALAVHVAALYLPPAQYVLRVEPIGLADWGLMVVVASTVLGAVELHKRLRRR